MNSIIPLRTLSPVWGCLLMFGVSSTIVGCNQADPNDVDDSTVDDSTVDDSTVDDSTVDDGATDDGATDDGATDDGATDDSTTDDSATDDSAPDDSTTDDEGTDDGPTDAAAYFPMSTGSTWAYRHTHLIDGQWVEEVTMADSMFEGEPAFLVSDTPDLSGEVSLQTWQQLGTQILRVFREQKDGDAVVLTVDYDPGFLRFDTAWTEPGVVTVNSYRREEIDPDGSTSASIREQVFTVLETDASVEVEAGSFDNCLLVERVRSDNGATTLFWFAKDVGKVREEDPDTLTTEELVSFTIGQ